MGVGIAIGNTVDNAGPALQRGEFVGVSIPIGMYPYNCVYSVGR
jgi:ACR3 family arsenite transporter